MIVLGSTVLGIMLLLKQLRPASGALLLALKIPDALGILQVISMAARRFPVMFTFDIPGRRMARTARGPGHRRRARWHSK